MIYLYVCNSRYVWCHQQFGYHRIIQSPTATRFLHFTVAQLKSNKQKFSNIIGTLRSIINSLKKAPVGNSHLDMFGYILKFGKNKSDIYHIVLNECLLAFHICIPVMKITMFSHLSVGIICDKPENVSKCHSTERNRNRQREHTLR